MECGICEINKDEKRHEQSVGGGKLEGEHRVDADLCRVMRANDAIEKRGSWDAILANHGSGVCQGSVCDVLDDRADGEERDLGYGK